MPASSPLLPSELIITDASAERVWTPPSGKARGLLPNARSIPFGRMRSAPPFPLELRVPRPDWEGIIKEQTERKSRLSDRVLQSGLPCKDQKSTNYCWIFAPVHAMEVLRVGQNQDPVSLSPASAGGPIKGFRNVGGWGLEGIEHLAEFGVVPSSGWPDTAISRSYYTAANKALARQYRVTHWYELSPRNIEELVSCLLRGWPVAVGYNWWRHEVLAVDAVWLDGTIAIRIRNSWSMNWPKAGAGGWSILQGNRMLPDDAVVPFGVTARNLRKRRAGTGRKAA